MGALLDRLDAGLRTVWLDYTDYAATLLAKGVVPWLDVAEFVSLQRRAQGLLKSDVVALALAPACAAWLAAHANLREAMAAKSRALFPLKTLLADEALRAHLIELANGLRASVRDVSFALVLPSPRAWVGIAYAQAFAGEIIEVGSDEADSASVYVADFLRDFGSSGVDILLLEEAADFVMADADDIACYQAVLNVAANYRWDAGLRFGGAIDTAGIEALDYVVTTRWSSRPRDGVEIAASSWSAAPADPPATARLRFAAIPAGAKPEVVLERLAGLR